MMWFIVPMYIPHAFDLHKRKQGALAETDLYSRSLSLGRR